MRNFNALIFIILFKISCLNTFAQETVSFEVANTQKVLFIGNSYTSSNNLPFIISNIASSTGNTLEYQSHTPGGARLRDHYWNAEVATKIESDNWNYVSLQAQSQETSWADWQVDSEVRPYAGYLSTMIRDNFEGSMPLFFMTWGRENGDAANCGGLPWVCTYEGMDDAIRANYIEFKEDNTASLSPVGAVWRFIRENHPTIELYSGDGSHPSAQGSYAAACTFYAMIYKKDPTLSDYNYTLSDSEADLIKSITKDVVFENIGTWQSRDTKIENTNIGLIVNFSNNELGNESTNWDFGDGNTSNEAQPTHIYQTDGNYTVILTKINNRGETLTITKNIEVSNNGNLVAIPDDGFRNFLQSEYPECFEGDSLNTICAYNHPKDSLIRFQGQYGTINDLTGIQYFDKLKYLKIRGNSSNSTSIQNLSILPPNLMSASLDLDATIQEINFNDKLEILELSYSDNTVQPNFPNGLKELYYLQSKLTSLVNWPDSLRVLEFGVINNILYNMDEFPDSLKILKLEGNIDMAITLPNELENFTLRNDIRIDTDQLPDFSQYNTLKSIHIENCSGFDFTSITNLNEGLEIFTARDCDMLTNLPNLPSTLIEATIINNRLLDNLPTLNNGLTSLNCSNNALTNLPNTLPSALEYLNSSDNNQLFTLPTLPSLLKTLLVNNDSLYDLPFDLPATLEVLECSNNVLVELPELPNTLKTLKYNNNNNLSFVIEYPNSIEVLDIRNNNLSCILTLPDNLKDFSFIEGNNITCFQNIPPNSGINPQFPICEILNFPDDCAGPYEIGNSCDDPITITEGVHEVNNLTHTKWYKFIPLETSLYNISTCGLNNVDSYIKLYENSGCDEDSLLISSDDDCSVGARIIKELIAGEVYIFSMNDDYVHEIYNFSLTKITENNGASCIDAIQIQSGTHTASNENGTQWFSYKIPANGIVNITTCDLTEEDTYLEIYKGCNNYIDESDDDCDDLESDYTINTAIEGEVYKLAWLDEYTSESFNFKITFTPDDPNYCDNYDNDSTLNITIEDFYVFGNDTLTASGTYQETFISSHECDSIVTLNLTISNALLKPEITWTNPDTITHGDSLSVVQLNAIANTLGTFSYNPSTGTVLSTGTHNLSVIFTPDDTVTYDSTSKVVNIVVTPISVPDGFTATAINTSQINLSWNDVAVETGYTIERSTSPGSGFSIISNPDTNDTTYSDTTSIIANTVYYYRIKANNKGVSSLYSAEIQTITPTLAPSNLNAVIISDNQIDLSWNDVTGETSYTLERAIDINATYTSLVTVPADNVSYSDNSTIAGNKYYYRIKANNDGGNSAYSNEASVFTSCSIPSNTSVTSVVNNSVTFNWDAISGANSYEIQYRLSGIPASSIFVNSANTTKTIVGLFQGTNYEIRVRTICTDGQLFSQYSSFETFKTTGTAACDIPSNVTISAISDNQANINWDVVEGAQSYEVQFRQEGIPGATSIINSNTNNANLSGLNAGANYEIRVKTICTDGQLYSEYSPYQTFTTTGTVSCDTPLNKVISNITDNAITYSWDEIGGAESYQIQYRIVGVPFSSMSVYSNTNTVNISGLDAGTNYEIRVRTICTSGQSYSAYTDYENFSTTGATSCETPVNTSIFNISDNSLTYSWDAVTGAESYQIQYRIVGVPLTSQTIISDTNNENISGLNPGTKYEIRVKTICTSGASYSEYSDFQLFNTTGAVACSIPSAISVSGIVDNSINISWANVIGAESYQVQYRIAGIPSSAVVINFGGNSNNNIFGLFSGTTYEIRVKTICSTGTLYSDYSPFQTFTTTGNVACAIPSGIVINGVSDNQATISWGAVAGATAYQIQYRESGNPGSAVILNTNNDSELISDLTAGTNYEIRIKTICSNGQLYSRYSFFHSFATTAAAGKIKPINFSMVEEHPELKIFPSPSDNEINIKMHNEEGEIIRIAVYNVVGSLVYHLQSAKDLAKKIEMKKFGSGIYLFKISFKGNLITKKVVIR